MQGGAPLDGDGGAGTWHLPHGSSPSILQHLFPHMIRSFSSVQQSWQPVSWVKHLPGSQSLPPHVHLGLFLLLSPSHGVATAGRVVAPRSAAPSNARKAVRRDLVAPKSRVNRSKFRWSMACILRRKVHKNADSRVDGELCIFSRHHRPNANAGSFACSTIPASQHQAQGARARRSSG
jgi:hypothetical protein